MNDISFNIPAGTEDILFEKCNFKRKIERTLQKLFETNGYNEVITPSIEFADLFGVKNDFDFVRSYRFTDAENRLISLRPDGTIPIARLVATRLKGAELPLKFFYTENIFRISETLSGMRTEETQCGIELIGQTGIESDIDILKLAVDAMKSICGDSFTVELSNVEIFRGLAKDCGMNEADTERARIYIENKNNTALSSLCENYGEKGKKLATISGLFGKADILSKAENLVKGTSAENALSYLRNVYDLLCKAGVSKYITFDLGFASKIDYYTGLIFRAYTGGSGHTVMTGGRYDKLIGKFGYDVPAIGFAISADTVCDAIFDGRQNTDSNKIRIAVTKGRLEKKSVELLCEKGYECKSLENKGRKLIFEVGDGQIEIVLAKAADVLTYVRQGVCDMGIVGKDTIKESGNSFYEVLDLGFGKCKFVLAGKKDINFYEGYNKKIIATKYPNITREFFAKKNMDVEIIKIEGSVELAPILGLADAIVDIMETGTTLYENGLSVIEDIMPVSARLIVNSAKMKLKQELIGEFIERIGK